MEVPGKPLSEQAARKYFIDVVLGLEYCKSGQLNGSEVHFISHFCWGCTGSLSILLSIHSSINNIRDLRDSPPPFPANPPSRAR